jgi:hypothetical protein
VGTDPSEPVGTPVTRNTSVNQIEVTIGDLRARVRPEMNSNVSLMVRGILLINKTTLSQCNAMRGVFL